MEIFHDVVFWRADQALAGARFEPHLPVSRASVFNRTLQIPKPANGKYIARDTMWIIQCGVIIDLTTRSGAPILYVSASQFPHFPPKDLIN